jgi:hypothetical protein
LICNKQTLLEPKNQHEFNEDATGDKHASSFEEWKKNNYGDDVTSGKVSFSSKVIFEPMSRQKIV